ncbi:XYLOGLUCAN ENDOTRANSGLUCOSYLASE/HYDROLASE PROTEIN 8-RELATED [Salix koriyanagi]|uniref:XYLOGLUCAN ENDOTRANSGLUCOSYLASE/HYDROLASE PROTEIN 8-RELATED n=1 Tax=Salix koriyanagi TaxID=2511006 RepID=A0A9Q0SZS6_9ROSI|nr:XYLOGLUCAN ENDOTRANSGLUCOSYLASE/HYDROLASE PROTEIN 8-RELATED [Salix koriyanagi]
MAAAYLWTLFLGMLVTVSGTMGAALRKPVDVPFGRNYVPTWAFDHINYFNGGNEIQLHLDKYTDGCEASVEAKFCATQGARWWDQKEFQDLDALQYRRLSWVRQKYTIYNYCTDRSRYPSMPPECKRDRDI